MQLDPAAWPGKGLSPLNLFLSIVILASVTVAIAATERGFFVGHRYGFRAAELLFGLIFLLEYAGRLWVAAECPGSGSAWSKRWRFLRSPSSIVDLVVLMITFAPFIGINGQLLRLVRLLRIVRIAKLGRMSSAMRHLVHAVASRRYELALTLMLAGCLMIFGASALYWVEGELQPDKFGSIPRALWWAVITLTTIGYGDVYPVTIAGKIIASIVAFGGIGLIAMPTGILAAAFSDALQRERERDKSD